MKGCHDQSGRIPESRHDQLCCSGGAWRHFDQPGILSWHHSSRPLTERIHRLFPDLWRCGPDRKPVSHFDLRRRQGAFSLFLILVTTSLVLIISVMLQAAQIRATETNLARAMNAQLQVTLAGFDPDLRQKYALFGFPRENLKPDVFIRMMPGAMSVQYVQLQAVGDFWATDQLRSQITRQMRLRLPITYAREFWQNAKALQKIADVIQAGGLIKTRSAYPYQKPATGKTTMTTRNGLIPTALHRSGLFQPGLTGSGMTLFSAYSNSNDPTCLNINPSTCRYLADSRSPALLASDNSLLMELIRTLSGLLGQALAPLLDPILQQALEQLTAGLELLESTLIPLWEPGSTVPGANPTSLLDPRTISHLSGLLDQMADATTLGVYDHFAISEYCLGYFTSTVIVRRGNGAVNALKTYSGYELADLVEKRPAEVERLVTGLNSPDQASLLVQATLLGLRSLIQLAATLTDSAVMSSLRTSAATVAAAILAVSGGTVIVDPEMMTYILAVIRSVGQGISDIQKLKNGSLLAVWPGPTAINWEMHYRDYLRLLLLLQPDSWIVHRVGPLIKAQISHDVAATAAVVAMLNKRRYRLESSYIRD